MGKKIQERISLQESTKIENSSRHLQNQKPTVAIAFARTFLKPQRTPNCAELS
jgi:hypothetical protein